MSSKVIGVGRLGSGFGGVFVGGGRDCCSCLREELDGVFGMTLEEREDEVVLGEFGASKSGVFGGLGRPSAETGLRDGGGDGKGLLWDCEK
jgi:hypothetical protein